MIDHTHAAGLLTTLRYIANFVLFGGFIVFLAAEMIFPPADHDSTRRRIGHGAHNLLLWLVGVAVMSAVFGSSVWFVLQWLQFRGIGILNLLQLPVWLHAIVAFLLLDACDYFFHRLSHNVRWLWLLHAVHHSDPHVDVTTNLRQHPLHIVVIQLWKLVACAAIGVPPWIFLAHEIINIGVAHLHHAAIGWPRWIDRVFAWLMITPRMHWNHHSPAQRHTNSNYGVILSIWDRWFGTMTLPDGDRRNFGLNALNAPRWQNAWGMLATPWRARSLRQF